MFIFSGNINFKLVKENSINSENPKACEMVGFATSFARRALDDVRLGVNIPVCVVHLGDGHATEKGERGK